MTNKNNQILNYDNKLKTLEDEYLNSDYKETESNVYNNNNNN